jgi:hypothetical protein
MKGVGALMRCVAANQGRDTLQTVPRTILAVLAVLGALGVWASSAAAATVSVPAAGTGGNYYTDTGIYIPAGETVTVTASGTWSVCQLAVCTSAPNGDGFPPGAPLGAIRGSTANNGVLVASTDAAATWTAVGSGPTVIAGRGELLLTANDTPPANGTCGFSGPTGCYSDNSGAVSAVITFNNVPTSTSECMNDGWRSLNDATGARFNNQGACVSYVASGGESAAGGQRP